MEIRKYEGVPSYEPGDEHEKIQHLLCFFIGLLMVGFIGSPLALAAKKRILIGGGRTGDNWYSFARQ